MGRFIEGLITTLDVLKFDGTEEVTDRLTSLITTLDVLKCYIIVYVIINIAV